MFASDNGIVMTCGDGTYGCLGHGNWNNTNTPKLVESLLTVDVAAIACGHRHVVVVGGGGEVYSWGQGQGGQLGLGHEEDCSLPQEVTIPEDQVVENVRCGGDGTIFITQQGSLLACGSNARNKLGLNARRGLMQSVGRGAEVEKALLPTPVKAVTSKIIDVSMGPHHTVALTENGHLVSFGRSSEGQLGHTRGRAAGQPNLVRSMMDKTVTMVQCGSTFTVVGTIDNVLYLWGTRRVSQAAAGVISRPGSEQPAAAAVGSSRAGSSSAAGDPDEPADTQREVQLQPREVLALYASQAQIAKGETLSLGSLHAQSQNVFVVVDTTCPLPRLSAPAGGPGSAESSPPPRRSDALQEGASPRHQPASPRREHEDPNGATAVPDWLRDELNATEVPWPAGGGGVGASPERRRPAPPPPQPQPPPQPAPKPPVRAPVTSPFAVSTSPPPRRPSSPRGRAEPAPHRPASGKSYRPPSKDRRQQEREQMLNEEIEKLRSELENQRRMQAEIMTEKMKEGDGGESGQQTGADGQDKEEKGCTVM